MTVNEIIKIMQEKAPGRTVVAIADLNSEMYVITAVKDPNKVDYTNPMFALSKKEHAIRSYSPLENLDEYTDAMDNRRLM